MNGIHATRWLGTPLASGWIALPIALAAVAAPTSIRAALNGVVTGCEFTPYLPFIMLSAILLRWWQAGAVALVSVGIMGGLFKGSLENPSCFIPAAGVFLVSSAAMIGLMVLMRRLVTALQNRGTDESAGGIVFSLEQDQVWASWYGEGAPVRLGTRGKVSHMMEDFLAQEELAKRLTSRSKRHS